MSLPPNLALHHRLIRLSRILSGVVFAIGALVFLGWLLNIEALTRLALSPSPMNPTTAFTMVCSGLSLYLLHRSRPKFAIAAGHVLAAVVLVIGAIKLLGLVIPEAMSIDTFILSGKITDDGVVNHPHRMSLNTASGFVLTGLALLLLRSRTNLAVLPFQVPALALNLVSLFSLLSYLYRSRGFFTYGVDVQIATHTAASFFLLSLALLFARPADGMVRQLTSRYSGSMIAKILLPCAIIVPAALGFLRLWGFWEGLYDNEFGVTLYACTTIISLLAVVFYLSYVINKRDEREELAAQQLRERDSLVQQMFENAPDAVIVIDSAGNVRQWNSQATELFGWTPDEMRGRPLSETIIPEAFRGAHTKGLHTYLLTGESKIIGKAVDLWAVTKDKRSVDVSLRISPMVINGDRYFVGFIRDITDRKKIENRLKSFNEELSIQVEDKTRELKEIFARITDGFIALDKDFNYIYVNDKAGELTRRDPKELIGRNVWDVFPQAVGSATYNAMIEAMRTQQPANNTDYYEPLDLWQENDIYPSPNGISMFIRDVTFKKRAEREVERVRSMAEKLVNSLPGVFYFYDSEGNFLRWNKQFEEVTGYTPEEIAEMHPSDFFDESEKAYMQERIAAVFENGEGDAEASLVSKTGKPTLYYFRAVLIDFDGKPCLLGTGIDITERRKAEEKLKASEQKYKLLFESNPLAMWMLSLPGYDVVEVNLAAIRQYGYTREEFMALDIFTLRPEEDINVLKARTVRSFRGIYNAGIWRHTKKNGDLIYVNIVTHDIYYEGRPTRLVLANEVTEQYLAEEKLKASYESIRSLTEHLQNIREEERLHIAREIHDELGQLLTVLKMDVAWLNKKINPEPGPVYDKLKDLLALIDTTVKTVRRIASELRPSLLDDLGLEAAMEWHLEEFERRSGIEQHLTIEDETAATLPDSLKIGLFRILQESLTNVARHSGAKSVHVNLHQADKKLILTITDDGSGFDPEQANKKTLGLLGMKERTLVMGGEYSITGEPGTGTTVRVEVPIPATESENE